jgi:hypothetical protein
VRPIAFALLVAACGARSGLDESPRSDAGRPDAPAADASTDAPRDAPIASPDAGPVRCPPRPTLGYSLSALGSFSLGREITDLSLGGDGAELYLAATFADGASELFFLTPEPRSVHVAVGADLAAVSMAAGVATALFSERATGQITLVRARSGVRSGEPRGAMVLRGPLFGLDRPLDVGGTTMLVGETSFEVVVAPADDAARPWLSFGPGHDVHAVVSSDARVHVLVQGGDERHFVDVLRSGSMEARVRLELGFSPPTAIGWQDDALAQPYLVAGFVGEPEGRLVVRRFDELGVAGAGFSAPLSPARSVDLDARPPPGHRTGYGVVGLGAEGDALFHGAGEDFVGDGRRFGRTCDDAVSITLGPCGYVIACDEGTEVHLMQAVAAAPR